MYDNLLTMVTHLSLLFFDLTRAQFPVSVGLGRCRYIKFLLEHAAILTSCWGCTTLAPGRCLKSKIRSWRYLALGAVRKCLVSSLVSWCAAGVLFGGPYRPSHSKGRVPCKGRQARSWDWRQGRQGWWPQGRVPSHATQARRAEQIQQQ